MVVGEKKQCEDCPYFFFYINNLLHGAYRQTMVSTFITTYKRMKLHIIEKKKRKDKKEKQITINKRKEIILLSHRIKMHLD